MSFLSLKAVNHGTSPGVFVFFFGWGAKDIMVLSGIFGECFWAGLFWAFGSDCSLPPGSASESDVKFITPQDTLDDSLSIKSVAASPSVYGRSTAAEWPPVHLMYGPFDRPPI